MNLQFSVLYLVNIIITSSVSIISLKGFKMTNLEKYYFSYKTFLVVHCITQIHVDLLFLIILCMFCNGHYLHKMSSLLTWQNIFGQPGGKHINHRNVRPHVNTDNCQCSANICLNKTYYMHRYQISKFLTAIDVSMFSPWACLKCAPCRSLS